MNMVSYDDLFDSVRSYINNENELKMISKAFEWAHKLHEGQKRQSGDDYIVHPLSVAFILSLMKADSDTICAALLHDTIEDTKMTKVKICAEFNPTIALLVDGVTKISKMNIYSKKERIAINTRKIITSLDEDVRIVIIKLADRLHNMRTLQFKSKEKQYENALETMEIFVPLSYYLGIYKIKSELEDLSLSYLFPEDYNEIQNELKMIEHDTDEVFRKMMEDIGNILADNDISFELKNRVKSIYGLYWKLYNGQKITNVHDLFKDKIMDIHDLLAIKILVKEVKDCYLTLGLIHSEFPPINNKFKDYIARPKTNMYHSLHTTVFGLNDYLVQMQIRTFDMENVNNFGLAAYFDLYPDDAYIRMQEDLKNHFQFFKSIEQLNAITTNNSEFVERVKSNLFNQSVYVYTTKGDVIELPSGSTPIDFAYKLGFNIVDESLMFMVNDKVANFDYVLQNKDRVKVLTSEDVLNDRCEKVKTLGVKTY